MAPRDRLRLTLGLAVALLPACFSEGSDVGTVADDEPTSSESGDATSSTSEVISTAGIESTTPAPDPSTSSTDPTSDAETSTGDASTCGDAVLDDGELCDGGLGCIDCVLEHYPCNPTNQVGCNAPIQTCDRTRGATLDDQRTGCFQEGHAGWGAACEYNPVDPMLQCADGLSCIGAAYHPACAASECCTEFCDLTDPARCPDPSTTCLTWKEPGMPPGLDTLGLCIAL